MGSGGPEGWWACRGRWPLRKCSGWSLAQRADLASCVYSGGAVQTERGISPCTQTLGILPRGPASRCKEEEEEEIKEKGEGVGRILQKQARKCGVKPTAAARSAPEGGCVPPLPAASPKTQFGKPWLGLSGRVAVGRGCAAPALAPSFCRRFYEVFVRSGC